MEKVTGADFKSATADDNKKLFIETYGCQMNVADSEVIASVMQMAGYSVADTLEEADAVFMNTCSIRDNAEQKILNRLEFFHSLKKKKRGLIVGVLGCMAERVKDDLITNHHVDLVVGPDAYLTLPELIASVEAGEKAMNVELSTTETYRDVIPSRICGNHISGFVSIMRGCNNFCTYCIVPYTRGRERSRDVESILNEVADLVAKGYKEVTLLGQNVNSYRFESRTEQPQRLDEVKVQSPPYVPKSSHPSVFAPTSTTASKPQKEASVEPITETSFDDDIEVEEPLVSTPPTQQDNSIVTETYSETPALTEKERRKAERQAKREARRREKAQKNN